MKKSIKYFTLIWFVLLAVFNAVTFILPSEIAGINRFEQQTFWIAYAFISLAFVGQLVTMLIVCNKNSLAILQSRLQLL